MRTENIRRLGAILSVAIAACSSADTKIGAGDPEEAFAKVTQTMCDLLSRCGAYGVADLVVQDEADCKARAGRDPVYSDDLDDATAEQLSSCLSEVQGVDRETCQREGLEDLFGGAVAPSCATVNDYLNIFNGDYDDPCQRAVNKWNECQGYATEQELQLMGYCDDNIKAAAPDTTVAFKSWSEAYLNCDPNPAPDCLCDGLPHYSEYSPD